MHEKNGKVNEMGCHHKLEQFLDEYIAAAGIAADKKGRYSAPPSAGRASSPTGPYRASMPGTWCAAARIEAPIGNHSFRAIGITDYLENGGDINIARRMAGHSNIKTTALYDRRGDEISFSEIERVGI
jgi:integrase